MELCERNIWRVSKEGFFLSQRIELELRVCVHRQSTPLKRNDDDVEEEEEEEK